MLEREASSLDFQAVVAGIDQVRHPHAALDIAQRAAADDRDRDVSCAASSSKNLTRGGGQHSQHGLLDDRGQRAVEIQEQQKAAGSLDAGFHLLRCVKNGREIDRSLCLQMPCLCGFIHGTSGISNLSRADRILPAQR